MKYYVYLWGNIEGWFRLDDGSDDQNEVFQLAIYEAASRNTRAKIVNENGALLNYIRPN